MRSISRVLICDDEAPLRELMRVALGAGHEFFESDDAATALDLWREVQPDAALIDVMLPGKSGLELLEEVRRDPDISATRIVVVSAWSATEDRRAATDAGADAFMPKPFDPGELAALVDRLLGETA